ncbi:MAG: hypothetical protein AAFR17_09885 [Pseudomonadota bacterium]
MTLADFERDVHRLVERALDAQLDPAEIADTLQAELDELDDGPKVLSEKVPATAPSLRAAGGRQE